MSGFLLRGGVCILFGWRVDLRWVWFLLCLGVSGLLRYGICNRNFLSLCSRDKHLHKLQQQTHKLLLTIGAIRFDHSQCRAKLTSKLLKPSELQKLLNPSYHYFNRGVVHTHQNGCNNFEWVYHLVHIFGIEDGGPIKLCRRILLFQFGHNSVEVGLSS